MSTKLCTDCFFYKDSICHKQYHTVVSKVTGKEEFIIDSPWRDSPRLQREDDWLEAFFMNSCGQQGRFWKAREV